VSKAIKPKLIHKGVRPVYDIYLVDFKKKIYYEEYPNGTIKLWNLRTLNSGCGNVISAPRELMDCYYCPKCDEYFSKNQWEIIE
jgi:hypothetical protein